MLEYEFKSEEVFMSVLRLIRYFNSGNGGVIVNTQAAYFQTEVIIQDKHPKPKQEPIFVCHYQQMRRVLGANLIQRWWRKIRITKKSEPNVLQTIKKQRAEKLIGKWLRDITFRHRLKLSREHSFLKFATKEVELCIQTDIYLELPEATNRLKISLKN